MSLLKKLYYIGLDLITFKKGIPRKINNHTIRFPARWSRYYESDYEKENYTFLEEKVKPGMQVIDIGAHLGLFSTTASQLAGPSGKIVCFEPTPGTYAVLTETLRINKCYNVTPVQAAVSDKEGETIFYISNVEACNSNSLVNNKAGNETKGYKVKLVSIDSVIAEYALEPALIKIDAEGAELDVLKGGVSTFREYKPVLILGLHPDFIKQKGDSLAQIWDLLKTCDYDIQLDGKTLTKEEFCNHSLLFDVHCF